MQNKKKEGKKEDLKKTGKHRKIYDYLIYFKIYSLFVMFDFD